MRYGIRDAKDIDNYRMKYGPKDAKDRPVSDNAGDVLCVKCGQPTNALMKTCESCLGAQVHKETMQHVIEWLRAHPETELRFAHDKNKVVHIAVPVPPFNVGFCGWPVTQQKKDRKVLNPAESFPQGLCGFCATAYRDLEL